MTPHFSEAELRCKGSGLLRFHPGFLDALEALRVELGDPMKLNSACRSAAHNRAVGGHPHSLHVGDVKMHEGHEGCLAVDVAILDGEYRGRLFALAWARGWSIGWNKPKRFLHLDMRMMIGLPRTTFDY